MVKREGGCWIAQVRYIYVLTREMERQYKGQYERDERWQAQSD